MAADNKICNKMLIVDDSNFNIEALRIIINLNGVPDYVDDEKAYSKRQIDVASSGKEAISKV